MDSVFYRRAPVVIPRPPAPVHIRSSSRGAALDALEYGPNLSRSRMAELTLLGETTLRRAIRQLSREGVLTPQSGRNAATVSVARYPSLPILEITDRRFLWRLCDTVGGSVCVTIRDRGRFRAPEEDFTALLGQVSAILGCGTCGLSETVPLQPPLLLCPDGENCELLPLLLPLMTSPGAILSPEDAAAVELRYLPAARQAESLLLIHGDEEADTPQITLFTRQIARDLSSPLIPSPLTTDLGQALRLYSPTSSESLTDFLRDLARFLRLNCVVMESDRPSETAARLRAALPKGVRLVRSRRALHTPSLAHRGALRILRRALWDGMEEEPLT